jgi:hypothetical protein
VEKEHIARAVHILETALKTEVQHAH